MLVDRRGSRRPVAGARRGRREGAREGRQRRGRPVRPGARGHPRLLRPQRQARSRSSWPTTGSRRTRSDSSRRRSWAGCSACRSARGSSATVAAPLSQRGLADAPQAVRDRTSKNVRKGNQQAKGFALDEFLEPFSQLSIPYFPAVPASQRPKPSRLRLSARTKRPSQDVPQSVPSDGDRRLGRLAMGHVLMAPIRPMNTAETLGKK